MAARPSVNSPLQKQFAAPSTHPGPGHPQRTSSAKTAACACKAAPSRQCPCHHHTCGPAAQRRFTSDDNKVNLVERYRMNSLLAKNRDSATSLPLFYEWLSSAGCAKMEANASNIGQHISSRIYIIDVYRTSTAATERNASQPISESLAVTGAQARPRHVRK